jgi:hypothetical protein
VVAAARSGGPPTPEVRYRPRRWLLLAPLAVLLAGSAALHERVLRELSHLPVTALAVWSVSLGTVLLQLVLSWMVTAPGLRPGAALTLSLRSPGTASGRIQSRWRSVRRP